MGTCGTGGWTGRGFYGAGIGGILNAVAWFCIGTMCTAGVVTVLTTTDWVGTCIHCHPIPLSYPARGLVEKFGATCPHTSTFAICGSPFPWSGAVALNAVPGPESVVGPLPRRFCISLVRSSMLAVIVDATVPCRVGSEGYEEENDGPGWLPSPQSLADFLEIGRHSLLLLSGAEYSNPLSPESSVSSLA